MRDTLIGAVQGPLERLKEMGLDLPTPPAPMASYVPTRTVPLGTGLAMVHVAGQVPVRDGKVMYTGRVPSDVSITDAQAAAQLCALNLLAQVHAASGLDKVEQVVSLLGFVRSDDGFGEQPTVVNAASDLLVAVLGEAGRHTRAAVGANELPRGVPVEIAAVFLVRT